MSKILEKKSSTFFIREKEAKDRGEEVSSMKPCLYSAVPLL